MAENGTSLNGLLPSGNTALQGTMNVQAGIVSAILPSGCSVSQIINGYSNNIIISIEKILVISTKFIV